MFDKYIQNGETSFDQLEVLKCFGRYDRNRDGFLDLKEFEDLLADLLSDGVGSYSLKKEISEDIFYLIDEDLDDRISCGEFRRLGYYWLRKVLFPVSALVIVDVQNDFIDGSLALRNCPAGQDGSAVIPAINSVLETTKFDVVVYSKDWHPQNHISFLSNINLQPLHSSCRVNPLEVKVGETVTFAKPQEIEQTMWPEHCVQQSWGSELHPNLKTGFANCCSKIMMPGGIIGGESVKTNPIQCIIKEHVKIIPGGLVVNKGTNTDVDSYSAFWDNCKLSQTELVKELSKRGVTDVYLCGLAYDICVGYTGLDAVEHGFRTILIEDACRGVDSDGIEKMRKNLESRGVLFVNSCKVKDIVQGHDRPPQLALKMARNVALASQLVKQGAVKSHSA